MKMFIMAGILILTAVSCTFMETKVNILLKYNLKISVTPNVHGNVMILTALPFAIPYASLLNVTPPVLSLKTLSAM